MADPAKTDGEISQVAAGEEGRYDCDIDGYSGHITFPYPMTYPHFQKWWGLAKIDDRPINALKWEFVDADWQAAIALLSEYGEWQVTGPKGPITIGDAKDGNLPLELQQWIVVAAKHYLLPQLDPKVSAGLALRL